MPEEKKNKTVEIILFIAAVVTVISFINKLLGKSDEEKAASKSRKDSYGKIKPSFEEYVYADYADSLEQALASGLTEDEATVYGVFNELKNISDVNKVIEHYGKRRVAASIGGRSLPETISALFSASEKARLNGILVKKGINYKFK